MYKIHKKQVIIVVLLICLMSLNLPLKTAYAADIYVDPAAQTVNTGEIITVAVSADSISDFKTVNFNLVFNIGLLAFTSAEPGNALLSGCSGWSIATTTFEDDTIFIFGTRESCGGLDIIGSESVMILNFQALNNAGTTNLTFSDYELKDSSNNIISATWTQGQVTVSTGDITPPVLTNGAPSGNLAAGTIQTAITLSTNENATCRYSVNPGTQYSSMTSTFSTTGAKSHSKNITGLTNGNYYAYYVKCRDAANNANTEDYEINFFVLDSGVTVALNPSSQEVITGDPVVLTLNINNAPDVDNLMTDIYYDDTVLAFDSFTVSGTMNNLGWLVDVMPGIDPNSINILALSDLMAPQALNGNAEIVNLYFTSLADGQSTMTYAFNFVNDIGGNPIGTTWNGASVTVNSGDTTPPVMSSVTITPNPAYKSTANLTANPNATDADGDSITYSYQWKKGGVNIAGQTGSTLSNANYVKNNIITVTVTPNDGTGAGVSMTSAGLTISNTVPTQPTVNLTSPAYDSTNLVCAPSGSTDADSDTITYIYTWQKNNVTQAGLTSNTVNASNTGIGETWKCIATTFDGTANGAAGEKSVIILADLDTTPPVITSVASSTTSVAATITWTTNEAATSQVNYGATVAYGSTTTIDASLITSHSVVINGLTANTTYHFRARSKDAANNERVSGDYAFKTSVLPDTTSPTIVQITAVPTPANDTTPNFTFSSTEVGTITYGGDCSSVTSNAVVGNNRVTFNVLPQGTHSNCTIRVTDASLNQGNVLNVNSFIIDTTSPVITLIGSTTMNILKGGSYTELGATTTDNFGQNVAVIIGGDFVNVNATGTYVITYNAVDSAGNQAVEVTRTVIVYAEAQDLTAPVRSNGSPAGSLAANTTGTTLSLSTDEIAECRFSDLSGSLYASMTAMSITGSTTHTHDLTRLANGTSYNYYFKCRDLANNVNADDYAASFSVSNPPSGGGGGGGGGSYHRPPTMATTTVPDVTNSQNSQNEQIQVLSVEQEYEDSDSYGYESLGGLSAQLADEISATEAAGIMAQSNFIELNASEKAVYDKVVKQSPQIGTADRYRLAYFIKFGTKTTIRLGAGERGGAVSSYMSAFNKFPGSPAEWQDVIKIANGRWPHERNAMAEEKAKELFYDVYKREPVMAEPHDNAAVTVIAYGLRPSGRNMGSEKAAIRIFKAIYNSNPLGAQEWDIMRAIAYSGAVR